MRRQIAQWNSGIIRRLAMLFAMVLLALVPAGCASAVRGTADITPAPGEPAPIFFERMDERTMSYPVVAQSGGRLYFRDGSLQVCSTDLNGQDKKIITLQNNIDFKPDVANYLFAWGDDLYYSVSYFAAVTENGQEYDVVLMDLYKHALSGSGEDVCVLNGADDLMQLSDPRLVMFYKDGESCVYDLATGAIDDYRWDPNYQYDDVPLYWYPTDETRDYYLHNWHEENKLIIIPKDAGESPVVIDCPGSTHNDCFWGAGEQLLHYNGKDMGIYRYDWTSGEWMKKCTIDLAGENNGYLYEANVLWGDSLYFVRLNSDYRNPDHPEENEFLIWKYDISNEKIRLIKHHSAAPMNWEIYGPTYCTVKGNTLFAFELSEYQSTGFFMAYSLGE